MYERRGCSGFGAFLFGGLLGAIVALLFAPRSGRETREMLTDKANEYWGQAGELYTTGVEKVTEAVDVGTATAGEKGEQLKAKIDEARARLQEQVAKSAETAKGRVAEGTPAVKEAVDKAAAGTKSGVDFAAGKAAEGLDFVAKRAAGEQEPPIAPAAPDAPADEAPDAPAKG